MDVARYVVDAVVVEGRSYREVARMHGFRFRFKEGVGATGQPEVGFDELFGLGTRERRLRESDWEKAPRPVVILMASDAMVDQPLSGDRWISDLP